MILVKTPLRISFFGGGTDLPYFYSVEPGAVLSATIDKYMYVMINTKFDKRIRLSYNTITENVMVVDDIQHDIVRNALKMTKTDISRGIEIVTIADVQARGTGLGSSSALSIGLLYGLMRYRGETFPNGSPQEWLADSAFELETEYCKKPIGKQDQYACATGGLNMFRFYPDGEVETMQVNAQKRITDRLRSRMLLFKLPGERDSTSVLLHQRDEIQSKIKTYRKMADLAENAFGLLDSGNMDGFGEMLDENWSYKKSLSSMISNLEIDDYYNKAMLAGASGGKVLGAGGGGFLLIYAEKDRQKAVTEKVGLQLVDFNFTSEGSHVAYSTWE